MTDTQYKRRTLPARNKSDGPEGRLTSYPSPLFSGPWKQAHSASDYTPSAHRPILSQHNGGDSSWLVGDTAPAGSQIYPEAGILRLVMQARAELAPGCALALRVVASRSGMTQWDNSGGGGGWEAYSAYGRLHVDLEFWDTDGNDDTASVEVELEPSLEGNGAEPAGAGAGWSHLLFKHITLIHTDNALNLDPIVDMAQWSENTTVIVTVKHEGGARVIHCSLVEVPYEHVVTHTEESDVSIHGWPTSLQATARPQIEDSNGATYDEHRLGPARGFAAAIRQSQRLGPTIAAWTSYSEGLAEVDDTDPDPISIASTTFVGLLDDSITAWSSDAPGFDVTGYYARRAPENLTTRLDGAGVIPVRCRVQARFTFAGSETGYVRFQSTSRSWVDVEVDQASVGTTWTWTTVTGFLECPTAVDDTWPVLVPFARVTGDQMEVRYCCVQFGDFEVGA